MKLSLYKDLDYWRRSAQNLSRVQADRTTRSCHWHGAKSKGEEK